MGREKDGMKIVAIGFPYQTKFDIDQLKVGRDKDVDYMVSLEHFFC